MDPNPYVYLITGAALTVITTVTMGLAGIRQAKTLHAKTEAEQRAQLDLKARHDLNAERRSAAQGTRTLSARC
ncbi:hypothetical protein [Streptomyces goshikiensis]|uniref:hypothetical protein n=1 Tax=Streptomyces goshikiensis TaxID=1942 RepID=UPI00366285E1